MNNHEGLTLDRAIEMALEYYEEHPPPPAHPSNVRLIRRALHGFAVEAESAGARCVHG